MRKVNKIVSVMIMVLVVASLSGFSFKAQAATNSNSYLPKGWTSLNFNNLTVKQKNVVPYDITPVYSSKLTSLEIIDLALDEKNEIHVVTKEIGTSLDDYRYVWVNDGQCYENVNEKTPLVRSDGVKYGYIRYFHTGIIYSSNVSGKILNVKAKSVCALTFKILTTAKQFILP